MHRTEIANKEEQVHYYAGDDCHADHIDHFDHPDDSRVANNTTVANVDGARQKQRCEHGCSAGPWCSWSPCFAVDRISTRLMHRAVDDSPLDVVWPAQLSPASAAAESQLSEIMHDASLPAELNDQQRRAIARLTPIALTLRLDPNSSP